LNLEKHLSPEQLVTIKLKNNGPRQGRKQPTGAYQTRTTTSFVARFTRNNRHDSPNAGRSQRA